LGATATSTNEQEYRTRRLTYIYVRGTFAKHTAHKNALENFVASRLRNPQCMGTAMKILMFGRGVIAMLYGWALERAGHQIEFYGRPGRIPQLGAEVGLDILDLRQHRKKDQHVVTKWPTRLRDDLSSEHDCDLIFVSVHHHQFDSVAQFLSTRAGRATIL